ncbi:hypothetical protein L228DRAFT_286091 [Xylona heveae TC161]|uniref:RAVE subunit 2/Rogdi n=1 Tax=Xylona heveae (strain CBS 132557 / TC161) TaxID=1328760 RepID=A0A164ZLA6_XYLHT|nr:hypothetical protein L228DRAFT_286091 [Xylona heveae TC161]KZF19237.1 hypothetical protein L228DRAFT_286091 [Xylona heveae TC161]
MSTALYPPISTEERIQKEEESLVRELEWLLQSLQETLASIRAGLEECVALLEPTEPGSTLVLSSQRSETIKGFVTRVGSRIVKGDIHVKLPSLPPPRGASSYRLLLSSSPDAPPFVLNQLSTARNLINQSLDIVDVSTWTGDAKNANFISGQLRLLFDYIQEAKLELKGLTTQGNWWDDPIDERVFDPPLPSNVAFHLSVSDAALELSLRTLDPAHAPPDTFSGFSLRDRLASAIGATRKPDHDEAEEEFQYRGKAVKVKEKVRVQSQDPSLLAIMAKLSALEHNVAVSRKSLDIVMGNED